MSGGAWGLNVERVRASPSGDSSIECNPERALRAVPEKEDRVCGVLLAEGNPSDTTIFKRACLIRGQAVA